MSSSSSSKRDEAGAAARVRGRGRARAKGRAEHKRGTEYSKGEVAGVGFKRVSGRVIFPRISYYLCVQGMNKEGGQKERREESEESRRGKGKKAKKGISQARTKRLEDRQGQGRTCRSFRNKKNNHGCSQTEMGSWLLDVCF